MPSPEKFRETLAEFNVDEAIVQKINAGYEKVVSKTNKKIKSAYMAQAITVMNEELTKKPAQNIVPGKPMIVLLKSVSTGKLLGLFLLY